MHEIWNRVLPRVVTTNLVQIPHQGLLLPSYFPLVCTGGSDVALLANLFHTLCKPLCVCRCTQCLLPELFLCESAPMHMSLATTAPSICGVPCFGASCCCGFLRHSYICPSSGFFRNRFTCFPLWDQCSGAFICAPCARPCATQLASSM